MSSQKLAVLVSGKGSLLKAIVEAGLDVNVVLADRSCKAVELAKCLKIPSTIIDRSFSNDFDRDAYTKLVAEALQEWKTTLVAMAGFRTILSPAIFDIFDGKILNCHPSLLPAFPGNNAVRDALSHRATVTGCTIHVATKKVDDGPILAQEKVQILPEDDVTSLHARINEIEQRLYPRTIKTFMRSLDRLAH